MSSINMSPKTKMSSERQSYPAGTRIYKHFPSHGWFWGVVDSVEIEANLPYYNIQYSDGDSETLDHKEIEEWVKHANKKGNEDVKAKCLKFKDTLPTKISTDQDNANDSLDEQENDSDFTDGDDNLVDTEDDSDFDSSDNARSSSRKRNLRPQRSSSRKRFRLNEENISFEPPDGSCPSSTHRRQSPMRTCKQPRKNVVVTGQRNGKKGTICHYFQTSSKINDISMDDKASDVDVSASVISASESSRKSALGRVKPAVPLPRPNKKLGHVKSKSLPATSRVLKKATSNASSQEAGGVGTYDKQPYVGGKDLEVISDIQHMFDDMISSKIFQDSDRARMLLSLLQKLQRRPLRVATMCSGTESPILALDMIQNAIRDAIAQSDEECWSAWRQSTADGPWFPVEHVFSCEIEPFKQAYIERNFHPPLLFRDIRELGDAQAYTAYGAYVDVPNTPGCVDVLIAGTSCVDYSNLNNQKVRVLLCFLLTCFLTY
jgi:hypothetical protein